MNDTMQNKESILAGLNLFKQALIDQYVNKEYSLNTRPQDYKGENAKDESLPNDWVDKLKPLSGGPEGGRVGDSGPEKKNTSTGSQSADPYIHKMDEILAFIKQMGGQMPNQPMAMGHDEMPEAENGEGGDDAEMMYDTEDVGVEEDGAEGVDDMMGDEGMDKMGGAHDMALDGGDGMDAEIVDALNQIKGILTQMDFAKQMVAETKEEILKSVNEQFATFKQDMGTQTAQSKQDNSAAMSEMVKQMLKSQGLAPVADNTPKRIENTVVSKSETAPAATPADFQPNDSMSKADDDSALSEDSVGDIHKSFVNQVESITSRTEPDDILNCFRFVNAMRNQTQDDMTHPLYYYQNSGV